MIYYLKMLIGLNLSNKEYEDKIMKASKNNMNNKAPDKIYLYPSDRAGEEYENEWSTFHWGEDCV